MKEMVDTVQCDLGNANGVPPTQTLIPPTAFDFSKFYIQSHSFAEDLVSFPNTNQRSLNSCFLRLSPGLFQKPQGAEPRSLLCARVVADLPVRTDHSIAKETLEIEAWGGQHDGPLFCFI